MAIPPGLGPLNTPSTGPGTRGRRTEEADPVTGPASGSFGTEGGNSALPQGGPDGGKVPVGGIAPSGTNAPADPNAASARLDATLAALSDPTLSDEERMAALKSLVNDPASLAELIIRFGTMSREQALDARLFAREQARTQLEGQAEETRQAATKAIIGAVVSFALSVASAVVSIGSALKGLQSLKEVDGLNTKARDFNIEANNPKLSQSEQGVAAAEGKYYGTKTDMALQKSQHLSAIHQSVAKLFDAGGQLASGGLQGASKIDEAEGQVLAAAAQDSQAMADVAKKQLEDMEELVKTAMKFMQELNRLETELMANFTRLG